MENLGFLVAMGAALAWGSYVVPFKKSGSSNLIQFQALMGIGIFIFSIFTSLVLGYPFVVNVYGVASGLIWAFGNIISLRSVSDIGMSRALPIWVSMVILVSFLWGAVVFHELPSGLVLGMLGIGLIITGVSLVGSVGSTEARNVKRGIFLAIFSGSLFGSQLMPLKLGHLSTSEFFFSMSLGILLFGVGFLIFKKVKIKNEAIISSLLSGVLWNIGNLLSIFTVSLVGLAKGFPLTQSSVLIAVCWGLFYFKEITSPKNKLRILIGTVILLTGVIVLGLA